MSASALPSRLTRLFDVVFPLRRLFEEILFVGVRALLHDRRVHVRSGTGYQLRVDGSVPEWLEHFTREFEGAMPGVAARVARVVPTIFCAEEEGVTGSLPHHGVLVVSRSDWSGPGQLVCTVAKWSLDAELIQRHGSAVVRLRKFRGRIMARAELRARLAWATACGASEQQLAEERASFTQAMAAAGIEIGRRAKRKNDAHPTR